MAYISVPHSVFYNNNDFFNGFLGPYLTKFHVIISHSEVILSIIFSGGMKKNVVTSILSSSKIKGICPIPRHPKAVISSNLKKKWQWFSMIIISNKLWLRFFSKTIYSDKEFFPSSLILFSSFYSIANYNYYYCFV